MSAAPILIGDAKAARKEVAAARASLKRARSRVTHTRPTLTCASKALDDDVERLERAEAALLSLKEKIHG